MERSDIKRRPLADGVLKALEPEAKDYAENDSQGLYFRVKSTGTKSWLVRYKSVQGKWAWKGIGGYPSVSGRRAREIATELLGRSANGEDISKSSVSTTNRMTLKVLSGHFYTLKKAQKRSENTLRVMQNLRNNYLIPELGDREPDSVTRLECNQFIKKIEATGKLSMADTLQKYLRQLYSFGIASGYCEMNPASELKHVSIGYTPRSYPYLKEHEIGQFLVDLHTAKLKPQAVKVIHTIMTTLCRVNMVRHMVWSEVDLEGALWTVPAHKMKGGVQHTMPLVSQAVDDLRALQEIDDGESPYVFKALKRSASPMMAVSSIDVILRGLGYQGRLVPHGFRHTASTLLREHGFDRSIVEAQLAHAEGGVAGVYNKAIYIDKRREMMQWYVDYIEALETSSRS